MLFSHESGGSAVTCLVVKQLCSECIGEAKLLGDLCEGLARGLLGRQQLAHQIILACRRMTDAQAVAPCTIDSLTAKMHATDRDTPILSQPQNLTQKCSPAALLAMQLTLMSDVVQMKYTAG